jgi:hypothetical protein
MTKRKRERKKKKRERERKMIIKNENKELRAMQSVAFATD